MARARCREQRVERSLEPERGLLPVLCFVFCVACVAVTAATHSRDAGRVSDEDGEIEKERAHAEGEDAEGDAEEEDGVDDRGEAEKREAQDGRSKGRGARFM